MYLIIIISFAPFLLVSYLISRKKFKSQSEKSDQEELMDESQKMNHLERNMHIRAWGFGILSYLGAVLLIFGSCYAIFLTNY